MQTRVRLGLSLVPFLASLLVLACKTVEKDESVPDAAAPPASAATADPLPTAAVVAPTPVVPVATPTPTPKVDAGTPIVDAGTPTVDAGKVVDAGGAANGTLKACSEKCQAVLQGCAIPQISKDGGLPNFKDPVACQAAANACFAACTP